MKFHLSLLLVLATSLSAVPSDINYQGRLTDANGDAVTGDVTMSVKMYDAQSGGNEIYSEDIGTVTLDENGVYSFQFGASGNSTVTKTETIVTSDGTSTEYTGTFTSTPIDGTISVTDETYSWNDVDGNPGEQATAYIIIINGFVIYADVENGGSGYDDDNPPLVTITGDGTGATATATVENGIVTGIDIGGTGMDYTEGDIIIAPPPAPFTVDKVDGNLEVGYSSSPTNGTGIVATYKTLEPSIIGALSEVSSHWLELTVDGTKQNPRERILSVPFAQVAGKTLETSMIKDNDFIEYGQITLNGMTGRFWDEYYNSKDYSFVWLENGDIFQIVGSLIYGAGQHDERDDPLTLEVGENKFILNRANVSDNRIVVGPGIVYAESRKPNYMTDETKVITFYKIIRANNRDIGVQHKGFTFGNISDYGERIILNAGDYLETINFSELNGGNTYFNLIINQEVYSINNTIAREGIGITGPAIIEPLPNNGTMMSYKIFRSSESSFDPLDHPALDNVPVNTYENYQFVVVEGSFTWDEANLDAIQRGGRLAILDTQEKILVANSFLLNNNYSNNDHFIGASDHINEGDWFWVNGDPVTENNWGSVEPNNANNGEHYAAISGGDLRWNDVPISTTIGYLLELPNP